jgi:hypothetical protein
MRRTAWRMDVVRLAGFPHLKAELNFFRLFNEAIEDFSIEKVAARRQAALNEAGLAGA